MKRREETKEMKMKMMEEEEEEEDDRTRKLHQLRKERWRKRKSSVAKNDDQPAETERDSA